MSEQARQLREIAKQFSNGAKQFSNKKVSEMILEVADYIESTNKKRKELAQVIEQQQKRIDELEAQLGKVNNKCVVYDLEPAQHESAIRDHLIKLGWTPPKGE